MSETLFLLTRSLLFSQGSVSMGRLVARIVERVISVSVENKEASVLVERLCQVSPSVFQYILDGVTERCLREIDLRDSLSQVTWLSKFVLLFNRPLARVTLHPRLLDTLKEIIIFSEQLEVTALAVKVAMSLVAQTSLDPAFLDNLNQIMFQNLLKSPLLANQQFAIDYFVTLTQQSPHSTQEEISSYLEAKLEPGVAFSPEVIYLWSQLLHLPSYQDRFVRLLSLSSDGPSKDYLSLYLKKPSLLAAFIHLNRDTYISILLEEHHDLHPSLTAIIEQLILS